MSTTNDDDRDETVTIKLETLKHLFDLAVDTPLVCSGSFDSDDVNVLRATATVLGVDPVSITPDEFVTNYPHPFEPRQVYAEPRIVGEYVNGLGHVIPEPVHGSGWSRLPTSGSGITYRHRRETAAEQRERMAAERADLTCHAGTYGRPCGRLAVDPLHHGMPLPKREDDDDA